MDNNMTDSSEMNTQTRQSIDALFRKYENDDYMILKIHNYVCNQLPNILENTKNAQLKRVVRNEEMMNEQESFIQTFLTNNIYLYVPSSERFFYYDGLHFKCTTEDNIIYHVLTAINEDRSLVPWKQKTKISTMKKIRENHLLKYIPESETIQLILTLLYPTIFSSRNEAKYFLCVLGDNIMKPHSSNSLIHYIDHEAKHLIRELNNIIQYFVGGNSIHSIKYKYHDHSYDDCRIIKTNSNIKHENMWRHIIHEYGIDLLCVACHYSQRYGSSDNFVLNYANDSSLLNNSFYLKNNSSSDIVSRFLEQYIIINNNALDPPIAANETELNVQQIRSPYVSWKDVMYLWKLFLNQNDLPPIMFLQTLKTLVIEKLDKHYNEEKDLFIGISSKFLPGVKQFLSFWEETIVYDDNESDFEIDELVILYKKWCTTNKHNHYNFSNLQILDLIRHFFPNIEIDKERFLSGVCSKLWDKHIDIQIALDNMREALRSEYSSKLVNNRVTSPGVAVNVSIYDTYNYYCKYHSSVQTNDTDSIQNSVVSKSYFEKYVFDNYCEFIVDNKFLSHSWYIE
jgi:hypothetical protein